MRNERLPNVTVVEWKQLVRRMPFAGKSPATRLERPPQSSTLATLLTPLLAQRRNSSPTLSAASHAFLPATGYPFTSSARTEPLCPLLLVTIDPPTTIRPR